MTDHKAARVLEMLADESDQEAGRGTSAAAACRLGAGALRQPRLPREWPLVWRKERIDGKWIWSAQAPINTAAVAVVADRPRIRPRVAGVWWSVGNYFGYCTTAWSARRAAARAVARAVRESAGGKA